MDRIQVFCDGGCRGNQNIENLGAWAFHMSYKEKEIERSGVVKNTTNNKQELLAVIKALKNIKTTVIPIDIHVDSAYVFNGMNEWVKGWKKKGWKTSSNKPVKNVELWKELDRLVNKQKEVFFFKVKGHSDDEMNNYVDTLVNNAMDEYLLEKE